MILSKFIFELGKSEGVSNTAIKITASKIHIFKLQRF